jgi:hypothetical protein
VKVPYTWEGVGLAYTWRGEGGWDGYMKGKTYCPIQWVLARKVISSHPPVDMKTKYMESSAIPIPWINISLTIQVTQSVKLILIQVIGIILHSMYLHVSWRMI